MAKSVASFLESSFSERSLLSGREIRNLKRISIFYMSSYLRKGGFHLKIPFISILTKWC